MHTHVHPGQVCKPAEGQGQELSREGPCVPRSRRDSREGGRRRQRQSEECSPSRMLTPQYLLLTLTPTGIRALASEWWAVRKPQDSHGCCLAGMSPVSSSAATKAPEMEAGGPQD